MYASKTLLLCILYDTLSSMFLLHAVYFLYMCSAPTEQLTHCNTLHDAPQLRQSIRRQLAHSSKRNIFTESGVMETWRAVLYETYHHSVEGHESCIDQVGSMRSEFDKYCFEKVQLRLH